MGIATVDGVTRAEKVTGIPKTTIDYWLDKPEFVQLRTTAREKVVEKLWVGVQVGVDVLTEGLRSDAPLHHKSDAFRALADRYALLNGEATERHEMGGVTAGLNDHEREQLRTVLRQAIEERESVE